MARYDVSGRHAIVTGGGNGIGKETARRLAARGALVSLIDLDAAAVEAAAAEIGDRAEPFVADVTDRASIETAIGAARTRFGPVDVAVAAAGISGKPTPALHTTHDQFERVVEVNLFGVWRTLSAVLPDVAERKGYLLPIASLAAGLPTPLIGPYGASKAGVHSLARTLRFELAHTGAKVGCGYFSLIDTNMVRDAMEEPAVKKSVKQMPKFLGRPASVESAGEAMARGVDRRSKRVCVPRWVSPVMSINGMVSPFESLAARDPRFVKNLKQELKRHSAAPELQSGASASPAPASQPPIPGSEAEEMGADGEAVNRAVDGDK